jgi:hypothetical protein
MFRLIRPFDRHAEVVGLFLGELGQLHADFFEVQAGDFLLDILPALPHKQNCNEKKANR